MPKKANPRQTASKHSEEWRRDLGPDRMAGQNIGGVAEEHDVEQVDRRREELNAGTAFAALFCLGILESSHDPCFGV